MTILLDTHILLWALTGSSRLSTESRDLIVDPTNTILASSINIAEIAINSSIHKLSVASSLESENYAGLLKAIEDSGFEMLPFTAEHAADPVFESYSVKTLN
ncbi:MAG: PIN domain-containing protein [Spirochaetaceae bacterium]|nr:MAG: PIN domain-containing protein [Spirochaetaceae bacterium]